MTIRPMWKTGQKMNRDDWEAVTKIIEAALAWGAAREGLIATYGSSDADAKDDAEKALYASENALYEAVREPPK